jgi:dihydrofolate synthase/folylpolyglutamate synthase
MPVSYQSAVARLHALGHELVQTPSHKFDLAHMRVLLAAMQNPERRFPSVLIAGTNGKGSTAATLASILRASGLRTGLYTSPHLIHINERVRINGEPISDDQFALLHDVVERTAERLIEDGELPWHPSFFEMLTAMAFECFANSRVDIAVLEVGMGGRLDATNVVEPRVSVITDISLDHQKYLGNTVAEITKEKAGIIRRGGILVILPQAPEANDVIGNAVLEQDAIAVNAAAYVPSVSPKAASYVVRAGEKLSTAKDARAGAKRPENTVCGVTAQYPLQFMGSEILVETPLIGRHQLRNIALAIAAAEELAKQGFPVVAGSVERGIRETFWPGRFQVIPPSVYSPEFVFDVAHNPAGAWALRSALSSCYEDRPIIFVFGAMRDKAIQEMAEILFPLAERVIATCAVNPRSATPEEIREAAFRTQSEIELCPDVSSAMNRASVLSLSDRTRAGSTRPVMNSSAESQESALVVVTGSIYVVGEAMQVLGVSADGK